MQYWPALNCFWKTISGIRHSDSLTELRIRFERSLSTINLHKVKFSEVDAIVRKQVIETTQTIQNSDMYDRLERMTK